MAKDVLITPASALVSFYDSSGVLRANITLDSANNLSIGDTTSDIYIGDGINSVDIIFEQNGSIKGTAGKTVTLGDSGSLINIDAPTTVNNDITFAANTKIVFPDSITVPDTPTNQQYDYMTFGSNGSISQISGRVGMMITSSDDSMVIANGDVGRNFTNSNISVGSEDIFLLSDGGVYIKTDLQEGWGTEHTWLFNSSGQQQAPNGTAALPAYTFNSDTNTGLYWITTDSLGLSTGGTLRLTVNTSAFTGTLPWRGQNGSAAAPAFSFSSNTNLGLYRTGDNSIGISTLGTVRLTVNTAQFTGTLPWRGQDGTVAAPAWSFSGDTDTGLYKIGTNSFGVSCGGTNEVTWTTSGQQVTSLGIGTAPSGTTGEIRATNNITAYYSDERLKEKTGFITNALEKLKSLTGFFYKNNETAKEYGYDDNKVRVGLSAQEIQRVLPEVVELAPFDSYYDNNTKQFVSITGNNYLTVDYAKTVPLLVEAIKELSDKVEQLEKDKG